MGRSKSLSDNQVSRDNLLLKALECGLFAKQILLKVTKIVSK